MLLIVEHLCNAILFNPITTPLDGKKGCGRKELKNHVTCLDYQKRSEKMRNEKGTLLAHA